MSLKITLILFCSILGHTWAQNAHTESHSHYRQLVLDAKFISDGLDFQINSVTTSPTSKITHVYMQQRVAGIPIDGTESSLHFASTGEVVHSTNHFLEALNERALGATQAGISAVTALQKVVKHLGYKLSDKFAEMPFVPRSDKQFLASIPGSDFRNIPAQLQFLLTEENELVLTWRFLIQDNNLGTGWTMYADANTGAPIRQLDWKTYCSIESSSSESDMRSDEDKTHVLVASGVAGTTDCSNCYEVFPMPLSSPYEGERQVIWNPINSGASPHGWHFPSFTTEGNNVNAFDAGDNYGYQPIGGQDLDFSGSLWGNDYSNITQYEDASIINLFYWVNIVHDVLYVYGFDEAAGNFQENNYGNGGAEDDGITAWAQTDDRCNAAFSFGPDGYNARLTSNFCNSKDGSYDSSVIIHEYGHGIYGRFTGGPDAISCSFNFERSSEGVSDWYALMLTMQADDTENTSRYIGNYLGNHGPDGPGVRNYPYNPNMNINPLTYDDIKTASIPHGVGEVWGIILWEITWALIHEHGFNEDLYQFTGNNSQDAGNIMALALITEGLRLQPCKPGFVDARDAILRADDQIYGGINNCLLWTAFAKRGLGNDAVQGSSENIVDNSESFDLPINSAVFNEVFEICLDDIVYHNLEGGTPLGGVYSGPGVTDNGNGNNFSFDVIAAGVGVHEIQYEVVESPCSNASTDMTTLTVILDEEAPTVFCPGPLIQLVPIGESFTVTDYLHTLTVHDNCDMAPVLSQDPSPGTLLGEGVHPIFFSATDKFGNSSGCSFFLTVVEEAVIPTEDLLNLSPNPAVYLLLLSNPQMLKIIDISFYDINGRQIKRVPVNNNLEIISMSVENLSSGMYFAFIETASETIVKRVIRK